MKIYIASHDKWAALHVAGVLSAAGHEITARWLNQQFKATESWTESERAQIATECERDVRASDALVLIAGQDKYPGGKFVEVGIAIGLNLPVVVVGRRENIMLWNPSVKTTDDPRRVDELLRVKTANDGAEAHAIKK